MSLRQTNPGVTSSKYVGSLKHVAVWREEEIASNGIREWVSKEGKISSLNQFWTTLLSTLPDEILHNSQIEKQMKNDLSRQ